ncbi:MAG TPA: hypothetical protein VMF69_20555 [Gemmataceae bacterium]|nr:hypothetical protein [Gemmataceae bacterium]
MHSYLLTCVYAFLIFLVAGTTSAEEARAVLDRAIRAHGGADRLERTNKGHLKGRIEGSLWNFASKVVFEETFDLPERYWRSIDGNVNGEPYHLEYAVTGTTGWIRERTDPPRAISVPEQLRAAQHWHAILTLLLSLRDKDVRLASLPDKTKDGRTFAGIRTTTPHGSGEIYFDKSTGLLAQIQGAMPALPARTERGMPDAQGGRAASVNLYDDYRDIQGVHYPMKIKAVSGENTLAVVTFSSVEFLDKIDDSVFLKPQTPGAGGPAGEDVARATSSGSPREDGEKTPLHWDKRLLIATVCTGVFIGALWFIVRASKRGKRETPPS